MLPLPPQMLEEIDQHWSITSGHFNGSLARLEKWFYENGQLRLVMRPTEYKVLLYSNRHVDKIKKQWGEQYLSKALGISANVLTKDNKLLMMRRSAHVGEYADCYDVFGGHIDCPKAGEVPDCFLAMEKELYEELAIEASRIKLKGIGLIEATAHAKPELLFDAEIDISSDDIIEKAAYAIDRKEYDVIFSINNEKSDLANFLRQHRDRISPSAFGCLSVHFMK